MFNRNNVMPILTLVVMLVLALNIQNLTAADKISYEQYLIESLNDNNVSRRASAAKLLGEQSSDLALEPLLTLLKSEKDFRVRIVAAVSLYNLGETSIVSELKTVFKKEKNRTVKHVLAGIIHELEQKTKKVS